MRVTRRNVLVMLGVLTIAGGALFGTGAFTQVQADRTVDVTTAADDNAQLGLNVSGPLAGSGDTISFNESLLNQDAVTYYNDSFTVTDNDPDVSINSLTIEDGDGNSMVDDDTRVMYFVEESNNFGSGGSTATYTVVFDTTNGDISETPDTITIVAES